MPKELRSAPPFDAFRSDTYAAELPALSE